MSHPEVGTRSERGDSGLTLVEMLVVLAIIGIVSGATLLSLAPSPGIGVEVEARRLAGVIQHGADATLVTDAPTTLVADAAGYRLATGATEGERHLLPAGIVLVGAAAAPVPLALSDAGLDLTIARGDDVWKVRFDGLRATAARAGPPQ